jgi:hypothetical protein
VNLLAACTLDAYCTDPPNPISGFAIGGSINESCSNQPVDNLVDVWKADAITEDVEASALGAFWGRTIVDQERSGNCNGANTVITNFYDPTGVRRLRRLRRPTLVPPAVVARLSSKKTLAGLGRIVLRLSLTPQATDFS